MIESEVLKPIGVCTICEEGIYDWERTITTEIDGETFLVHNRPGCRDIWDDIRKNPHSCIVCKKKTRNLKCIDGTYYIVCRDKCIKNLQEKIGSEDE